MRLTSFFLPSAILSMKARVPECATVPSSFASASALMPMPLSEMVSVRSFGSGMSCTTRRSPAGRSPGSVTDRKRSLSSASEAFETSSRRNTSGLL